MGTFHENLVQSFTNFKNKFIGDPADLSGIGDETTNGAVKALWNYAHNQLSALKNTAIASAIGISASDTLAQAVTKLGTIVNRGAVSQSLNTSTTSYTIPAGYHDGSGSVSISTESKSASPSTSTQTISPSSGKLLSSVSVSAISPQRTAGTVATRGGIDGVSPYVYFPYGWWPSANNEGCFIRLTAAQAIAACPSQTKSVTATTSAQTVTPDSGKLLSSVTVNAQSHSGYYPSSTTYVTSNGTKDLGANHNYRYVRVSINQTPSSTNVLDWTQNNSEITYKDISLSGYSSYTVIVVTRYGSGGVSLSNRSGCTVSTIRSGAVVNGDSNSSYLAIYQVTGSGTVRAQGGYVSDVFVVGHSC